MPASKESSNSQLGSKNQLDNLVKEYLEKGGTITKCEPGATTPNLENQYGWGKRKPQSKKEE